MSTNVNFAESVNALTGLAIEAMKRGDMETVEAIQRQVATMNENK